MIRQFSIFIFALSCIFSVSVDAQSMWKKSTINTFRGAAEEDRMILPEHFEAYTLSFEGIKAQLENAPIEDDRRKGISGVIIELPLPDGSFETFEVYDSPVFAPKLAAKFPTIKSYKGKSINTPGMNVRFDTGPYGLHAAIHSTSNIYYIDPYSRNVTTEYLTYDVKDHVSQIDIPVPMCGTEDDLKEVNHGLNSRTRDSNPISLSTYRFALSCTGEWGAVRGTEEKALADMNTGINRINQIYENELAIRLILIDDNDKLLNFDPQTDPYLTPGSGTSMLNANTNITNLRVGLNSYDIGHVYGRSCDTGGIAALGSMCNNNRKAAAVTCHYSNNLDFMAASVTSHEIGHQMTAQHTFNHCDNDNEQAGNAFEPGSGSTIMSYGGLCGSLNIFNGSDDYYHVASLIQIYQHTRGDGLAGDGCGETIETENLEPTVNILHESGFSIPERTYFYLEGEGMDENEEDQLTYTWEQMNLGPLSPLGAPIGNAPHFRSFPPSENPLRYFPSADNILAGNFDKTEVAFVGDRVVDFILTVRDNNSEAGTAVWEPIQFNVVETPVRFEVTSQNSGENYTVGEETDVTWNVAGTDLAPINVDRVDILFFSGTQLDFDLKEATVLAKNVFNNGSCKVIIPNEITDRGRVIVKASESIFFTINKANIKIDPPSSSSLIVNAEPLARIECLPTNLSYELNSEGLLDIEGDITYTVLDGLPDGAEVSFDPEVTSVGSTTMMTINPQNSFVGGDYEVRIGAITESMDTFTRLVYLNLRSNDHRAVEAVTPEMNAAGIGISPGFSWEGSPNAITYTFEISKSPTFGTSNILETSDLTDLTYNPTIFLDKNTVYYWRVVSQNYCGEDPSPKTFAFATESLFCSEVSPLEGVLPINISGSGKPTIEAPIVVTQSGTLVDVNVKQFFGEHSNNKDMIVSLISPEGKRVVLVSNKCEQQNFNCGFDDASDIDVKCPLNNGNVYKPTGSLASFNGDELEGTWLLEVEDTQSGNGGRLEGVIVEFCSNQVLDNPILVRNERITIPWGATPTISAERLKAEDANNISEELIYTIVNLPNKGTLSFDGNDVNIGDQFSQQDIDDNKLVYTARSENYETYFSFTVVDGEGGFIGITDFEIVVNNPNSVEDKLLESEISIYPNPARNLITIDLSQSSQNYLSFDIINLKGQKVLQRNLNGQEKVSVDISLINSGLYIINLKTDKNSISKRIVVN